LPPALRCRARERRPYNKESPMAESQGSLRNCPLQRLTTYVDHNFGPIGANYLDLKGSATIDTV
jgi:hypothetical protein